jgi:hypothetical protein
VLGVLRQKAHEQQRQDVQARGDAEDQFRGGEAGVDGRVRYPGISRAAFAAAPSNLDTLRVSEGMLAILLAGGLDPQTAAWAIDSLTLYVNAYSLEVSLVNNRLSHSDDNWVVSRGELLRRFAALPDTFPQTKRYAAELTAGTGHDRFDFTLGLMIDGLVTPHLRLPDHAARRARSG